MMFRAALSVLAAVLFLFLLLPVVGLFVSQDPVSLQEAAGMPEVQAAVFVSVTSALYAVLLGLLFGVPAGYILARKSFRGKGAVEAVIDAPIVIPHTISGIALLVVFGTHGLLSTEYLGIRLFYAQPGIVAAMLFVSASFIVNFSKTAFEGVDPKLNPVARSLGAREHQAFFRVELPCAYRGILNGAVMAWARSVSEFGAVAIIAYHPMTAPVLIYDMFVSQGLDSAMAVAAIVAGICLASFFVLRYLSGGRR